LLEQVFILVTTWVSNVNKSAGNELATGDQSCTHSEVLTASRLLNQQERQRHQCPHSFPVGSHPQRSSWVSHTTKPIL